MIWGRQVLDLYNQQVYQGIAPTMLTTIDSSSMTFVTIMSKEIIYTAPNGKKYSIQIRKYTPRDCFRLMGVHEADIDKLLSKEKTGQLIISNEQTLCPSRKFNSNKLPDRHVRGADFPFRESLPRQDWSAITILAYGYFRIYQGRQAHQQSAQSPI